MFDYFAIDTRPKQFDRDDNGDFSDIVACWQDKMTNEGLPSWHSFDVTDFSGWHAMMAISEVVSPRDDLRFRYFGSDMVALQGSDLTGERLSERLPEAYDSFYRDHIVRIIEDPCIALGHPPAASDLPKEQLISVLYLPLAEDGKNIDRILHFVCRLGFGLSTATQITLT